MEYETLSWSEALVCIEIAICMHVMVAIAI